MPTGNGSDDDLITTDQVLARLDAHPSLRLAVALCTLPAKWVDDVVYFRSADLDGWIRRQLGASRGASATSPDAGGQER